MPERERGDVPTAASRSRPQAGRAERGDARRSREPERTPRGRPKHPAQAWEQVHFLAARRGIALGLGTLAIGSTLVDAFTAPALGETIRTALLVTVFLITCALLPPSHAQTAGRPKPRTLFFFLVGLLFVSTLATAVIRGDALSWWVVGLVLAATILFTNDTGTPAKHRM